MKRLLVYGTILLGTGTIWWLLFPLFSLGCEFASPCSALLLWTLQNYPGKLFVPGEVTLDSLSYLADIFGIVVGGLAALVFGYMMVKGTRRKLLNSQ